MMESEQMKSGKNRPTIGFLDAADVALTHYVAGGALVVTALAFYLVVYPAYFYLPSYARISYVVLAGSYLVIAPFFYFVLARRDEITTTSPSRTFVAAKSIAGMFRWPAHAATHALGRCYCPAASLFSDSRSRDAVLIALLKFFYAPLMISFFFGNIENVFAASSVLAERFVAVPTAATHVFLWHPFFRILLSLILVIDTFVFAVAYLLESKRFGNEIKSVDTTLAGWGAALAAYYPLPRLLDEPLHAAGIMRWVSWSPSVGPLFVITLESVALLLMLVYLWGTLALFTKASNLANRGIIDRGPYRYIRHPQYAAKNLAWLFELLPYFYNPLQLVHWGMWVGVYVARAVTEERHLSGDPDYAAYRARVRYRFIPRVW